MKRILCLLSVVSLVFLSGCWDRVEINDLAIVTAAAIDLTDDNQIEVALQIFIPKSSSSGGGQGGGGSSGGGPVTLLHSHKGRNFADAVSKIQSQIPRRIFWGQCKVFIFGERLAKKGIQRKVDVLIRHPQIRERSYLFVTEENPKLELESQPPLERYSAESIRELSALRIGMNVTPLDLDEMLTGEAKGGALPIIKGQSLEGKQDKSIMFPNITGTAIFKGDKMIGKLSGKKTRGLLWLRNEMESYSVTVKLKGVSGDISLNPVSEKIKMVPKIENGKWKMYVKINTEGAVIENGTNLLLSNPQTIRMVESAFQETVKRRIHLALDDIQHKMKVDIIGVGKEFHRKYPKQWKKVENRWEQVYPDVQVTVDVEGHIRRQGYITKPGGMPEEEVRKE